MGRQAGNRGSPICGKLRVFSALCISFLRKKKHDQKSISAYLINVLVIAYWGERLCSMSLWIWKDHISRAHVEYIIIQHVQCNYQWIFLIGTILSGKLMIKCHLLGSFGSIFTKCPYSLDDSDKYGLTTSQSVLKATDWVFHTGRVFHVWCSFWPSYTCWITIIPPKNGSLKMNSLL